jgi:hypothetical protein
MAWLELAQQVRGRGKPSNTDFSIAACLARIVDVKTGNFLGELLVMNSLVSVCETWKADIE